MKALLLILLFATVGVSQTKAPLPTQILGAHTVFLANNGVDDELFDLFYAEIKAWGRYEITTDSTRADLILEMSSSDGKAVYTNPANLRTYSYDKPNLKVSILNNHNLLWAVSRSAKTSKIKDQQKVIRQIVGEFRERLRLSSVG